MSKISWLLFKMVTGAVWLFFIFMSIIAFGDKDAIATPGFILGLQYFILGVCACLLLAVIMCIFWPAPDQTESSHQ